MVQKLGLGQSFPRLLLHTRKRSLGVGLIEPQTAIDLLVQKFHVGNKILVNQLGTIINTHEEKSHWISGLSLKNTHTNSRC